MTENEAVERLITGSALRHACENNLVCIAGGEFELGPCDVDVYDKIAADLNRLVLTSHPAVEALRELIEAHDTLQNTPHSDDDYRTELRIAEQNYESAWSEARSVLASLPKEK